MYDSSSLNRYRTEAEEYTYSCSECGSFIGVGSVNAQHFICELCRRVLGGEEITSEAIAVYRASKMGESSVNMAILEAPKQDAEPYVLNGLAGRIFRALGAPFRKEKPRTNVSVAVSNSRQRPRLFEQVDMSSIDRLWKKQD